jgi:L-alanine-DL-glutamate epimerase-like enolase superfamily enzyme
MVYYKLEEQLLELKYTWKIARNSADTKINFFIRITDNLHEGIGEVAPNVRYDESKELIKLQFETLLQKGLSTIQNLSSLANLFSKTQVCNSLKFGIESAFVHYCCKRDGISVFEYLNIQAPKSIFTAFSMPIMPSNELCSFYQEHNLKRFKHLKLKVNAQNAVEAFEEISKVAHQPIMVDGNETWQNPDEVLNFIKKINIKNQLLFVEQPMPADEVAAYNYLKTKSSVEIIADESVTNSADMSQLKQQFHGINMKLMKAGGYQKGIEILNAARANGLKTMIGCMVETSIGISSAMNLCANVDYIDLDGCLIIKNEPFGYVKEESGQLNYTQF